MSDINLTDSQREEALASDDVLSAETQAELAEYFRQVDADDDLTEADRGALKEDALEYAKLQDAEDDADEQSFLEADWRDRDEHEFADRLEAEGIPAHAWLVTPFE